MKKARLAELIGEVQETFVDEALPLDKGRKTHWFRWTALAACACLVLAVGLSSPLWQAKSESVMDPGDAPAAEEQKAEPMDQPGLSV